MEGYQLGARIAHRHVRGGRVDEADSLCGQCAADQADPLLARLQAQIALARQDSAQAESLARHYLDLQKIVGTAHRPDSLPLVLIRADSLHAQARYDEAVAALTEARSIVADFKLPADDAWRRALATWLQRAKDLGRSELAASLEAELAQASATPMQAITVLDKFRIIEPRTE